MKEGKMFFGGLILFSIAAFFLPWYAASALAFTIGLSARKASISEHLWLATAAGVVSAAGAFLQDGKNYGLVSQRMSGMFMLPWSGLIFVVMFVVGFLSVFLWLRGGLGLRQLISK